MAPSSELDRQLEAFDRAWQRGSAPPLADFLPAAGVPAARARLLQELVKIDLEYRWRARASVPVFKLEDYVQRFPELAQPRIAPDLIGEEYRARQRWGDRPGHAEYQARYPHLGTELRETLGRIDAALKAEYGPRMPAVAAPGPGSLPALVRSRSAPGRCSKRCGDSSSSAPRRPMPSVRSCRCFPSRAPWPANCSSAAGSRPTR